jgi:hypothetical protein
VALVLIFPSELKTTYPDAHLLLRREVVNHYSLLYTLEGSDPTLAPLLVHHNIPLFCTKLSPYLMSAHIASGCCACNRIELDLPSFQRFMTTLAATVDLMVICDQVALETAMHMGVALSMSSTQ